MLAGTASSKKSSFTRACFLYVFFSAWRILGVPSVDGRRLAALERTEPAQGGRRSQVNAYHTKGTFTL